MKKILLLFALSFLFAKEPVTKELKFILQVVKQNIQTSLPIKLNNGGIIKDVEVKNDRKLVLTINFPYSPEFDKKRVCQTKLVNDILNAGGEIEYIIVSPKEKREFLVNKKTCLNVK